MKYESKLDQSVNYVEQALEGFFESRYVRKFDDYFICYLSSQSGCNRGCKFCFLTAMKQTKLENSTFIDYLSQAKRVFQHYSLSKIPAKYVHYNFMARGEPLSNHYLTEDADTILYKLGEVAKFYQPDISVKFNISTILPRKLDKKLEQIFQVIHPTIYYSMYSADFNFRKHWLPDAMKLTSALELLASYQQISKKRIKIHHCLIKGQNDTSRDANAIGRILNDYGLDWEFNLVRYNPFSSKQGEESAQENIDHYLDILSGYTPNKIQTIPRVGFDVSASCGMFVKDN